MAVFGIIHTDMSVVSSGHECKHEQLWLNEHMILLPRITRVLTFDDDTQEVYCKTLHAVSSVALARFLTVPCLNDSH